MENVCSDIFIAIYCLIRSKLPIQYNLPFLLKSSSKIKSSTPKKSTELSPIKYLSSQKITGRIFKNSPIFEAQKDFLQKKRLSSQHLFKKYISNTKKSEEVKGKSTFAQILNQNEINTANDITEEIPIERKKNEESIVPFFDKLVKHSVIKFPKEDKNKQNIKFEDMKLQESKGKKICGLCNQTFDKDLSVCPDFQNKIVVSFFSGRLYAVNEK